MMRLLTNFRTHLVLVLFAAFPGFAHADGSVTVAPLFFDDTKGAVLSVRI